MEVEKALCSETRGTVPFDNLCFVYWPKSFPFNLSLNGFLITGLENQTQTVASSKPHHSHVSTELKGSLTTAKSEKLLTSLITY